MEEWEGLPEFGFTEDSYIWRMRNHHVFGEVIRKYLDALHTGQSLEKLDKMFKADILEKAMEEAGGNKAEAARILAMNRTTLTVVLKRNFQKSFH